MITFNRLTAYIFQIFAGKSRVGIVSNLKPMIYPCYNRDITVICTQNPGLGQFLYKTGIFHNP